MLATTPNWRVVQSGTKPNPNPHTPVSLDTTPGSQEGMPVQLPQPSVGQYAQGPLVNRDAAAGMCVIFFFFCLLELNPKNYTPPPVFGGK